MASLTSPELLNDYRSHVSSSDSPHHSQPALMAQKRAVLQVMASSDQSPGRPGQKETKVPADRAGTPCAGVARTRHSESSARWSSPRHARF